MSEGTKDQTANQTAPTGDFQQAMTTDQYQALMIRAYRKMGIYRDLAQGCEREAALRWMAPHFYQLSDLNRDDYETFSKVSPPTNSQIQQKTKKERKIVSRNARVIIIITALLLLLIIPSWVIVAQSQPTLPAPTLETLEIVASPAPLLIVTAAPDVAAPVYVQVDTPPSQVVDLQQVWNIALMLFALICIVYIVFRERNFQKAQERFTQFLSDKKFADELERGYQHASMNYQNFIEVLESAAKILGGANILPANIDKLLDETGVYLEHISDGEPNDDMEPPKPPPDPPPLITPSNYQPPPPAPPV